MIRLVITSVMLMTAPSLLAFDIELERIVLDQKLMELDHSLQKERAKAKAYAQEVGQFELIYESTRKLHERGVISAENLAIDEANYRLRQLYSQLHDKTADKLAAQIELEKAVFQGRAGEQDPSFVAEKAEQLSLRACEVEGAAYEVEDVELVKVSTKLSQLTKINTKSPGSIPLVELRHGQAETNHRAQLKAGFLESWRSCRQRLGLSAP